MYVCMYKLKYKVLHYSSSLGLQAKYEKEEEEREKNARDNERQNEWETSFGKCKRLSMHAFSPLSHDLSFYFKHSTSISSCA